MMSKKETESQIHQSQKDIEDSNVKIESIKIELAELSIKNMDSMDAAKDIGNQKRSLQTNLEDLETYKSSREERLEVLQDIGFRHVARAEVRRWERDCRRIYELLSQNNNRVKEIMRIREEIDSIKAHISLGKEIEATPYWKERSIYMPNMPPHMVDHFRGKQFIVEFPKVDAKGNAIE